MKKYEKLKKNSKKALKYHLFYSVIVCFLTSTILNFSYKINNLEIVNRFLTIIHLDNVIAPIMTSDTGAWRQTIFYPYMYTSVFGRGTVLNTQILAPVYDSKNYCDVSYLDSVCVWDEEKDTLTIFAVNKSLEDDLEVSCDLRQFEGYQVKEHIVLTNDDMKAVNTEAAPDNVVPVKSTATKISSGRLNTVLGKHSWNMIRLGK